MPDDGDITSLEARVERLEGVLRAEGLAAPPDVEVRAIPPNIADGDIITAAHINAIKASVNTWQGDVSAAGFRLNNLNSLSVGRTAAADVQLDVYNAGSYAQVNLESGLNHDTGYIVKDATRSYKLGIAIGGGAAGRFQIYGNALNRTMFACDDANVMLFLGGTLKTLSVDGSGFVKAT